MQATQETEAVIAVEQLVKRYRRAQHNAVDGLSFQVRRGEIFGLPPIHGQELPTLALGWILLALCTTLMLSLWGGIRFFHRRVIN